MALEDLKSKTDIQLAEYMVGYKEHTAAYVMCEMEFKRRQARGNETRGWISLGISAAAFIISVAALVARRCLA